MLRLTVVMGENGRDWREPLRTGLKLGLDQDSSTCHTSSRDSRHLPPPTFHQRHHLDHHLLSCIHRSLLAFASVCC